MLFSYGEYAWGIEQVCIIAGISNSFQVSQKWNSRCSRGMYGASSDTKTSTKTFADFPYTSLDPIKRDFFEQNWIYLPIPFSSGVGLETETT